MVFMCTLQVTEGEAEASMMAKSLVSEAYGGQEERSNDYSAPMFLSGIVAATGSDDQFAVAASLGIDSYRPVTAARFLVWSACTR